MIDAAVTRESSILARVFGGARHLVRAAAVLGLGLTTIPSCLETLPAPLQCPARPKFAVCSAPTVPPREAGTSPSPSGPVPLPPPSDATCALPTECLRQQGRVCECTVAAECTRANSCSPPPECPSSVSGVAPNATCLDGATTFSATQQKPGATCACGCASCADACDGQGPILGAGQGLRVALPTDLPSKGQLGVMVRMRGPGVITAILNLGGKSRPFTAPASPRSREDFVELILGPAADWTTDTKPIALILTTLESAEIDCIVPYFTP